MSPAAVRQMLHDRGIATLLLTVAGNRWAASGRTEGSGTGYLMGFGATTEAAIQNLLFSTRFVSGLPAIRYFQHKDTTLILTCNGQPPLRSEGPFVEINAEQYVCLRDAMTPVADDLGDLL